MVSQNQKSGDYSTNFQANVQVNYGLSASDVRDIALGVFNENFIKLSSTASATAKQRAEEFTEKYIGRLQNENPSGLAQASNPDFQYVLFSAQKEFARSGDVDLGNLLISLLIDRTKQLPRNLIALVLNEAIETAPKLTEEQLTALSLRFLFTHVVGRIYSGDDFWKFLDTNVKPITDRVAEKEIDYLHLQSMGCGIIGIGKVGLVQAIAETYGGIFSLGFHESEIAQKGISLSPNHPIFIKCLNNSDLAQINALNKSEISNICRELQITNSDRNKLIHLHASSVMATYNIRDLITNNCPYMIKVFGIWDNLRIAYFDLSSVGIAIGHAYAKKNVPNIPDLSIWIK